MKAESENDNRWKKDVKKKRERERMESVDEENIEKLGSKDRSQGKEKEGRKVKQNA